MRVAKTTAIVFVALAALLAARSAMAQPATPPYETGARPGNEIGTGQSLPLSDKASNTNAGDTKNVIAPRLPTPQVSESSGPRDFLIAARQALATNQTGEAQEALERAESRALEGNILASDIAMPSQKSTVQTIAAARQALAEGDRGASIMLIDKALAGL